MATTRTKKANGMTPKIIGAGRRFFEPRVGIIQPRHAGFLPRREGPAMSAGHRTRHTAALVAITQPPWRVLSIGGTASCAVQRSRQAAAQAAIIRRLKAVLPINRRPPMACPALGRKSTAKKAPALGGRRGIVRPQYGGISPTKEGPVMRGPTKQIYGGPGHDQSTALAGLQNRRSAVGGRTTENSNVNEAPASEVDAGTYSADSRARGYATRGFHRQCAGRKPRFFMAILNEVHG